MLFLNILRFQKYHVENFEKEIDYLLYKAFRIALCKQPWLIFDLNLLLQI